MHSNPKCYANAFCDCSEDMTHEHFVSHSALKHLAANLGEDSEIKNTIEVSGFAWQGEDGKKLLAPNNNTLAPKVLCGNHNKALSPLDKLFLRFFITFSSVAQFFGNPDNRGRTETHHFDGHDFERYLIKILAGSMASGQLRTRHGIMPRSMLADQYINILLGKKNFEEGRGFYLDTGGPVFQDIKGFEVDPWTNQDGHVIGCRIKIHDLPFILTLFPLEKNKPRPSYMKNNIYRPGSLNFICVESDTRLELVFDWLDGFTHRKIDVPVNFARILDV